MRKPFALLLFGFVATTSQGESTPSTQSTPPGLPKDVVPRSYLIHLEPDIGRRVIDGVESIEIEVLKPTTQIILNAVDTQIAKARIALGVIPRWDLRHAISRTLDWYRQVASGARAAALCELDIVAFEATE